MTPTNWDTTTATTSAMLAGWRQDHFSFDFRVGRFINHIVLNAQEVSEPYHPLSEHVAAQTQAIREAEAQAQVPGRRFKHRFPYTPQYPPPITYGTTPGSIKRAESAALMNERPKKKSKSKRSQKKSAQSQSQSQLQLQSQQSAEEKKAEQKGSTDVHIDDNNNNNNSNSTEKALKDPTQNAQN